MIYQRKPHAEIEKIKKNQKREAFSPMTPFWLSLGSSLLIFLFMSHFPARFNPALGFTSKSILVALASGTGVFVFLYAMQLLTRRAASGEPRAEICSVCFKAARGGERRCPCGGEYESVDFYDQLDQ